MENLKEYIVSESAQFSKMENNPMIYLLIIPKVLKAADVKDVKSDDVVKNAVNKTEKFVKTLSKQTIKDLENTFKPYAILDMFKYSNNYKATFEHYLKDFKTLICNNEANFMKCMKLDKEISELYNSPEYLTYRNLL